MSELDHAWTMVIPVKRSEIAKSRLEPALGPWRVRLAQAFAADTVAAVRACPAVGRIVVVGDEMGANAELPGADLVRDPSRGADMNAAVLAGLHAAQADPHRPVAVVAADLPALRPAELTDALTHAAMLSLGVVGDTEQLGTTMLASTKPWSLTPRFGNGSYARHLGDGARPVAAGPGLMRDIDVPEHITQAVALGVGPRTASVVDTAGIG